MLTRRCQAYVDIDEGVADLPWHEIEGDPLRCVSSIAIRTPWEMLPEYIHMNIAESILFAGKVVRIIRNPAHSFRVQESIFQQHVRGSQCVQGYTGNFILPNPLRGTDLIAEELFPQREADKIEEMLQELKKSSEFHKRSFESSVNSICTLAANHSWQLVVIHADLNGHLKALKDYFLLAKGDFFQAAPVTILRREREGVCSRWWATDCLANGTWTVECVGCFRRACSEAARIQGLSLPPLLVFLCPWSDSFAIERWWGANSR
ncbi:hypothetical protein KSP39_PZI007350 [Platanthera zijinensis]|uniref:Gamma-tubulin complex component n=1 Tax=Platanthera zijinensis TaxID=2320716 RepID=A0AAP0G9P2_9ASPA